jgi:nucleoside-diphosphate-sugar epimerase
MSGEAAKTAFVTGATGFLGSELVRLLVARGCQVFALARSPRSVEYVRRLGAVPVAGDLRETGRWQDEAAAEWVFHIPPYAAARGPRRWPLTSIPVTPAALDAPLLDSVFPGATRRVVYVADASFCDPTGPRPITEDELIATQPRRRGLPPALDRLDGYAVAGLPIVTAIPGCIYGNGSWFRERVIDPVLAGGRVLQFGRTAAHVSPVLVHDCARALIHLAERGEVGNRYFIADNEPVPMPELARKFACAVNRSLRVRRLPAVAARLLVDRWFAHTVRFDAAFSNIRLRGTGFRLLHPTLDHGLLQVLETLHE